MLLADAVIIATGAAARKLPIKVGWRAGWRAGGKGLGIQRRRWDPVLPPTASCLHELHHPHPPSPRPGLDYLLERRHFRLRRVRRLLAAVQVRTAGLGGARRAGRPSRAVGQHAARPQAAQHRFTLLLPDTLHPPAGPLHLRPCRDKPVAVVGGGDVAMEEVSGCGGGVRLRLVWGCGHEGGRHASEPLRALTHDLPGCALLRCGRRLQAIFLARYASKVYIVQRFDHLEVG